MRNPNPSKLFESTLYEGITHWGIAGNFYWYVSEDKQGRPLEIWPMHPALTKVQATKQGEITGYVMRSPNGDEVRFEADKVLDFPLPNPTNDLPDTGQPRGSGSASSVLVLALSLLSVLALGAGYAWKRRLQV